MTLKEASFPAFSRSQKVTCGPLLVGDNQQDAKTDVDGVTRMSRLKQVGEQLNKMMNNMRRGRRAFRHLF